LATARGSGQMTAVKRARRTKTASTQFTPADNVQTQQEAATRTLSSRIPLKLPWRTISAKTPVKGVGTSSLLRGFPPEVASVVSCWVSLARSRGVGSPPGVRELCVVLPRQLAVSPPNTAGCAWIVYTKRQHTTSIWHHASS